MKGKTRHQQHITLLRKLVDKTDYYIAHVWNEQGRSMHGKIVAGQQRFVRYGDYATFWCTPYLPYAYASKIYFAVMPRSKKRFGMVLKGWNELKWFVNEEVNNG